MYHDEIPLEKHKRIQAYIEHQSTEDNLADHMIMKAFLDQLVEEKAVKENKKRLFREQCHQPALEDICFIGEAYASVA